VNLFSPKEITICLYSPLFNLLFDFLSRKIPVFLQKNTSKGRKNAVLRCKYTRFHSKFNSKYALTGVTRRTISCAQLASGTNANPLRKGFHQTPFSLAAVFAQRVLLLCY
jgi:hypothetical protein